MIKLTFKYQFFVYPFEFNMAKRSENGSNASQVGLLGINNLKYALEPDFSVALNATHKQHYFQQTEYSNTSNTTSICVINSGSDYVDTKRSFLNFTVRFGPKDDFKAADLAGLGATSPFVTANSTFGFNACKKLTGTSAFTRAALAADRDINNYGKSNTQTEQTVIYKAYDTVTDQNHGSAMNLIKQVTITSRSGDEISRIDKANLLEYVRAEFMRDDDHRKTIGSAMGQNWQYSSDIGVTADAASRKNAERTLRVSIPIYCLSGLFNYDRLMPSQLMSGLQIRIEWERPEIALVAGLAGSVETVPGVNDVLPVTEYHISDIYFNMMSVQLTDSVQRMLNEHSATNGLEIVFADWANTSYPILGTHIHAEVRQAVSRALRVFARIRVEVATDKRMFSSSFEAERWRVSRYQWQLGSLYFPQQPIAIPHNTSTANIGAFVYGPGVGALRNYEGMTSEAYLHSLDCFGAVAASSTGRCAVSNSMFELSAGIMAACLERSSVFNLSGIPINNSRVLSLNAEYDFTNRPAGSTPHLDIFLQYVRLCRVWLTNTEVEQ